MRIIRSTDRSWIPAGHEDPQDPGVWKRVLFEKAELQPGRVQMINYARLPAGRSFAPHYHEDMQEVFIIVRGTPRAAVGDQTAVLHPGDAILIDAREVHDLTNEGQEDVEYLALGISGQAGGRTVVVE